MANYSDIVKQTISRLSNANSYIDQADLIAFCNIRDVDITTYTESQIAAAIFIAADYINALEYKDADNSLVMKFPINGKIPEVILIAQCWITVQFLRDANLMGNWSMRSMDNENIKRETVGPLTTEYFTPGEMESENVGLIRFGYIQKLLADLLEESNSHFVGAAL